MSKPWPGMLRGIWGDDARYAEVYWSKIKNKYLAGDNCRQDKDGYYWIMGRIDDVLNVAGHRLSTIEIESALVSHPAVAEAAAVGRPHEIKGEAVAVFVVLKSGEANDDLRDALKKHVRKEIGALAVPDDLRFTNALPKTRSARSCAASFVTSPRAKKAPAIRARSKITACWRRFGVMRSKAVRITRVVTSNRACAPGRL